MNCKQLVFAGMAAAGLLTQPAQAADLPARSVYKSPAVVAPVASWTGWYVGAGGGYGLFDADTSSSATTGGARFASTTSTTGGKGYFGRLQTGYDYQFGSWVAGVFGDWDFSSIKGTVGEAISPGTYPLKQTSAWAVGGRIGYLVFPSFLTYFDGGYANARFKAGPEIFAVTCLACGVGATGINIPNQKFSGYFLGGGTEYMIAPGWFVKSEYRLASYGSKTIPALLGPPATTGGTTAAAVTIKPVVQTITAELVYKFNWGQ